MNINKTELHEIIKGIKEGKEESFHELYKKYNKLIYGIAFSVLKNKEDSEDVTQLIFTKIYEIEKEKLPEKNETSWLYTVVKNRSIDVLRKKKKEIPMDEIYDIIEETDEIKAITEKEFFNSVIGKLNETEKQIVTLKIISQMSFKEIANLLDMSIGTVSWKYYQSLHTLKSLIANVCVFVLSVGIFLVNHKNQVKEESIVEQANLQIEETNKEKKVEDQEIMPNALQEQANFNTEIKEDIITSEGTVDIAKPDNINSLSIITITLALIAILGSIIFLKTWIQQIKRKNKK